MFLSHLRLGTLPIGDHLQARSDLQLWACRSLAAGPVDGPGVDATH